MAESSERIVQDASAAERPPSDPMSLERMRRAPTHPGEIFLRQFLEGSGAHDNQTIAARVLGWNVERMNEFVLGKRPLTYEDAIDLGQATNTSPEFWATLQMRHDLWHAMKARQNEMGP